MLTNEWHLEQSLLLKSSTSTASELPSDGHSPSSSIGSNDHAKHVTLVGFHKTDVDVVEVKRTDTIVAPSHA